MKRNTLAWVVGGVVVLGLAAITMMLGRTLMPPKTTAQRIGTLVPYFLTWGMIWMTAVIAVIIAINLFWVGLNSRRRPTLVPPDPEPAPSTQDARLP